MNEQPDLSELAAFVAVAKHRNFRKAAEDRGVSASALSHRMRNLEARLGVRLLNRTTRSVTPTEAGQRLLSRLLPVFDEVVDAVNEVTSSQGIPKGTLRLNLPHMAVRLVVAPVISAFSAKYPDIKLELVADDRLMNIVDAGYDAGMRFGEHLSPDMIAIAVGPEQYFSVVASPKYFCAHETPDTPECLLQHNCINRIFPSRSRYAWEFQRNGQPFSVTVDGRLAFSDEDIILQSAIEGEGIAYVYKSLAEKALKSGQLIEILEHWLPAPGQFYLYYHGRRHMQPALRVFIDFIKAAIY